MHKYCLSVLVALFSCAIGLNAQEKKDTIFLKNGTVVIGKLLKIKMGVMTFDPDDANDITVRLIKVKGIHASRKVFRVESKKYTGRNTKNIVAYGTIVPDSSSGYVRVYLGASDELVKIDEIVNLYPYSDDFIQRFSGNAAAGYNYTRSSSFGRLNFDLTLKYNSQKHEGALYSAGIYSQTDTGFTRDREEINLKDNFYFSPTSFTTGFLVYQRNLELGLARRYQEGIGIGNKFVTSKIAYAWARTGLVFNQEKSLQGISSGTLSEGFIQIQCSFFKFTKPEIMLNITQAFYAGITEKGRIRTDGKLDATWEIVTNFKFNIQLYDNYDSKPPVAGSSKLDYGIVVGISYFFL